MATRKPRSSKAPRPAKEKTSTAAPAGEQVVAGAVDATPTVASDGVVVRTAAAAHPVSVETNDLLEVAQRWSYLMSHRQRLPDKVDKRLQQDCERQLESLGIGSDKVRHIAQQQFVEIAFQFSGRDPRPSWTAPWEQLLSLATHPYRDQPLTVVRRIVDARTPAVPPLPERLLLIESAPGPLRSRYGDEFKAECRFVRRLLVPPLSDNQVEPMTDPTLDDVGDALKRGADIIHLTTVDSLAGWNLIPQPEGAEPSEGIILRGKGDSAAAAVSAKAFAAALQQSGRSTALVSFSTCYSAAQSAALAVAVGGARLAIGFSSWVDGSLAEQFFGAFYNAWTRNQWNTLDAFAAARSAIGAHRLTAQGGAAVLWSDHPLVAFAASAKGAQPGAWWEWTPPSSPPSSPLAVPTPPAKPAPEIASATVADDTLLEVVVTPLDKLNYSLLHNKRSLFKTFTIQNPHCQRIDDIEVSVQLHVGDSSFPWLRTLTIESGKSTENLSDLVSVPLVATILRQVRESIRTSLLVDVKRGKRTIRCETFPVTLLSADEWRDEPEEWRWLPCFVLPRDAAAQRVLDCAQRYLRALADDSAAGFDGYQRLRTPTGDEDYDVVDLQVRAIWSALVHDFPLGYINPPPSDAAASQRIRTPTQILTDRRGTCIDLALLFAGCLEYIGVAPVIFLIQGHCFMGYWRSPAAQADWMNLRSVVQPGSTAAAPATPGAPYAGPSVMAAPSGALPRAASPDSIEHASAAAVEPWMALQGKPLAEVLRYVQDGTLVPLETTLLTRLGSFADACDTGLKNLNFPEIFDAMIDIHRARAEGVTPLPLQDERR